VGEDAGRATRRRLTINQAADQLGVTVDAVRGRIKRGTIAHVREGGRVYVLLAADESRPGHDQDADQPDDRTDALIAELQDRVRSLEDANRENRRIIAALTSRIPQLEAPQETPQDAQTVEGEPERAEPRSYAAGAQEGAQRPWWRRVFSPRP
jgi:predicted ArsR family transcriptional regulator